MRSSKRIKTVLKSLLTATVTSGVCLGGSTLLAFSPAAFDQNESIRPSEMILSFDEGTSKLEKEKIAAEYGAKIVKHLKTSNSALIKFENSLVSLKAVGAQLSQNSAVKNVRPNKTFQLFDTKPNDSELRRQYHHNNIQSFEAWTKTTGSAEIPVAIIDTGIVLEHEDLVDNLWRNPGETGLDSEGRDKATNGIDDDENGYIDDFQGWDFVDNDNIPDDRNGHGTHCAGIVGGVGDNGKGISGVNWNVGLVGLKIFGASGSATEADIVEAIEYSNMMGFQISNNSWGGPAGAEYGEGTGDLIYEAIKEGQTLGHLFVFAAGNSRGNSDVKPLIPAAYDLDAIISVAASTQSDSLAGFSNYGLTTVDIAAPGAGIYSTFKKSWFGSAYRSLDGTSMAAPIVAGAATLLKSVNPSMTSPEIKSRILETADPVDALEGKIKTGGRLNLNSMISEN